MKHKLLFLFLICSAATFAQKKSYYLFTSFRDNGQDGLHLALSKNGHDWWALKGDQSFLKPQINHPDNLMRDPDIKQGPDGTFHMVWTISWNGKNGRVIGYANSKDLINWSAQKAIPVLKNETGLVRNVWAPELFYDKAQKDWLIIWSSTVKGNETVDGSNLSEDKYHHRFYYVRTKDFETFSETSLFYDPGFNSIDATLLEDKGKFYLFFKDERLKPVRKNLRFAVGDTPAGPFRNLSESFSGSWVEGPSAIKIGDYYYVYFDHYTKPHYYGAYRSTDLVNWQEVSPTIHFPQGMRHGSIIKITKKQAKKLENLVN
ncbi:glycoside hydrolase family 43 protein [Emticicia fluvialis]|uniref:glycoside hydrolase family 43 protein n=1 Tax=Emticicia fluvialis TaxID=2974474 RepID=UPI0021661FB4|nr:glycoside hydrolase family 43 protein [Emticicia fluvialis]